jgi:hypothetical protein
MAPVISRTQPAPACTVLLPFTCTGILAIFHQVAGYL